MVRRIEDSIDGGGVNPSPDVVGPRVAVIFLQPRCNMHCTFCITEDNFNAFTFDQAARLLRELRAGGTVRSVVLGGGEPFDWPHDVARLAAIGKTLGFTMQVGTNGIAVPDRFERLDAIDRWVLPLESVAPESHNAMRLYRGRHHAIILDRLESLRRVAKSVTISTVITQTNFDEASEVGRFLGDYVQRGGNVHAWHLYQFLSIGRGGAVHGEQLALLPGVYEYVCAQAEALGLPFRIYRRTDMYHSRTVEFFWMDRGVVRCGSRAWAPAPVQLTVGVN